MYNNNQKAHILEIFSSIQGEGPYIGLRQIFVRFKGCNLRCSFCDTDSFGKSRGFSNREVIKKILSLRKRYPNTHSVSLTGGEPLLHSKFLAGILPELKKRGFKVYLETNGTLCDNLKEIIGLVDIVSMDIKLPGTSEGMVFWDVHKEFLKVALKKEVNVKIVVSLSTKEEEFFRAVDLLKGIDRNIPLVIQPVSSKNGVEPPKAKRLFRFYDIAGRHLREVRIIPQIHKILKVR